MREKITVNIVSEAQAWEVKGQGVYTATLVLTEALKKRSDVEVYLNANGLFDIAHLHTPGPYAISKGLFTGKRLVISAHVVPESVLGSFILSNLWLPLFTSYLIRYYNLADMVIAVSPKVKEELEEIGVKAPIVFIPNPVNLERFYKSQELRIEGRKKLGLSNKDFVVICSGQIQPRKGVDTFLEIAKILPFIKFVWVGGQPFSVLTAGYIEMNEKIKKAPPNVIFTGLVPYEEMPIYLNAADIFFFPSYQENFPMAVLEAASCGLPLLLRDNPEYREPYKDWYIPAKNDEEFKNYILKLHQDISFREEYQKRALRLAKEYSADNVADMMVEVYKEILSKPPRMKRDFLKLEPLREEWRKLFQNLGHKNIHSSPRKRRYLNIKNIQNEIK
ncbi:MULTISPECIES: glycosyltransferase [Dictyoglomus]|jgi:1,2-diacylglycerol-3-alpha-glucose alpha-1,2-galactosyltransferase|uniref:Glycosyl transferase group 1 n=1 Tax=Dictyoglomus turgidum (strain DSM 6724 / Z-1310) TaxID=515635 RepID=B8E3C5_DICTD|nr:MULTISPECIES: glycosyltransferase [Dictyoglomus]ACK42999.1 glycosyl transferase group 1 [Dictyoglomus turgidum DSM 6724]PNV78942.1 MAG: glycosyltransferase family 1 protein [Dictyoglomus turgidum]HBU31064.1 glycosyltransferase family 1 protein [Dictyoglomus sp.]